MEDAIVAGYDGSAGAQDALALGQALSDATGRQLALVCVSPPAGPDAAAAELLLARAQAVLAGASAPDGVERRVVAADSVARGLHRVADSSHATAIVVGSPERALPGRIAMGTVAQRLLHGSPCSVALAPRGHAARDVAEPGFRAIVVAYTASDEARAALRVAAGLAQACGATVRVVSVVGPAPEWHNDPADWVAAARATTRADLDRSLRALASTVSVEGRVLEGDPVARVLESARDWADLIVAGSRGYGPRRRVLLGSVSSGLLELAQVPVLVTPRGAESELVAAGA